MSPAFNRSISGYCGPGPSRTGRLRRASTIGVAGVGVGLVGVSVSDGAVVGLDVWVNVGVRVGESVDVSVAPEVGSAVRVGVLVEFVDCDVVILREDTIGNNGGRRSMVKNYSTG